MIAAWDLIGGVAGIIRMFMGAALAALAFWWFIIPGAVADAKAVAELTVRAAAAEGERDELARQVNAGKIVTEAYQVQLKNSRAAEAAKAGDLAIRIKENETLRQAAGRGCGIDDADRRFLLSPE